eukprot:GEMP01063373.1.p1 GENE.GEMP01063373.1~~GEMP01063373.1.p1  ORF type:complete len:141 (+),score=11.29 GEMP01063373.1:115-537(+)
MGVLTLSLPTSSPIGFKGTVSLTIFISVVQTWWAVALGVVICLAVFTRVQEELLLVVPGVGFEIRKRRRFGSSRQFIPMEKVTDILVNEAIGILSISSYLAIQINHGKSYVVPFETAVVPTECWRMWKEIRSYLDMPLGY